MTLLSNLACSWPGTWVLLKKKKKNLDSLNLFLRNVESSFCWSSGAQGWMEHPAFTVCHRGLSSSGLHRSLCIFHPINGPRVVRFILIVLCCMECSVLCGEWLELWPVELKIFTCYRKWGRTNFKFLKGFRGWISFADLYIHSLCRIVHSPQGICRQFIQLEEDLLTWELGSTLKNHDFQSAWN